MRVVPATALKLDDVVLASGDEISDRDEMLVVVGPVSQALEAGSDDLGEDPATRGEERAVGHLMPAVGERVPEPHAFERSW